MRHVSAVGLIIALSTLSMGASAATVDYCPADNYMDCPNFTASRSITEHTQIIDNRVSGFTRSTGSWKIVVGYGPPESCAKISVSVDMGPFDGYRTYERSYRGGGGEITDSGPFMHRVESVESGLRIALSSCLMPAPDSEMLKQDHEEKLKQRQELERRALEEERERLALEEEREQLALEEERERLALEEERERLAVEEERERERLAQKKERERLAMKRERERLAQQKERERLAARAEEQRRQRVAQQRQAREEEQRRQRLAQEQREREEKRSRSSSSSDWLAVAGILSGVADALAGRSGSGGSATNALSRLLDASAGGTGSGSLGGNTGGSCEQAQRRVQRKLASLNRSSGGMGMCDTARHYVSTMQDVRRQLARGGCPAYALREYDRAISQAKQTARASCN